MGVPWRLRTKISGNISDRQTVPATPREQFYRGQRNAATAKRSESGLKAHQIEARCPPVFFVFNGVVDDIFRVATGLVSCKRGDTTGGIGAT